MYFKPRFSKRDDGGYDASYGKGGKKITAVIRDEGDGWQVISGWPAVPDLPKEKKLKDLKAAWGEWAAAEYAGTSSGDAPGKPSESKRPSPIPSPAPPTASGPPSYTPGPPPTYTPPTKDVYTADPFDPDMHHPGGELTPLGALDEVYHHIRRNPGGHFLPDGETLRPPWDRVVTVLQRDLGIDRYPNLTRT